MRNLSQRSIKAYRDPQIIAQALEATEFTSIPPHADNYKFLLGMDGSGIFWVPPFEVAGGQRHGEIWDKFEDAPIHIDVVSYLGWDDFDGAGYCTDGEIQVNAEEPISKFADQIFEWWPNKEYITWDGKEVPISSLEWFKSSNKKKQRRRRHKNKQKSRSHVPYYYGAWWGGWNPDVVLSPGDSHSGGGSTEQSSGGDFGGGGGSMTASTKKEL
jgi:hypothetical protein